MTKKLNIGSIKLPVQAATKGFAFIGKRGSGKSYGAAVLAEEFAVSSVPFVVFDPIDVWWGLRLAADGKTKGLPVVVFGKEHADIQLKRGMGREIAQAIVRENISCVISTFGMSKSDMREIVADFSRTLLNINNTPRHVFIEEAHEYVPQRVMGATAECFSAVEALIVMGRNRGIGVSLLNQRMATINKDVVSQIDTLVAFRSVGPQDRKALKDWVEAHEAVYAEGEAESDFDKFIKSVPSLPSGEAWVWSPEFMQIFERVKFRKRRTFHPDREKIGSTFKMPKISATDIQSFVEKFQTPKAAVKGNIGVSLPRPVNAAQRDFVITREQKARQERDQHLAKQELATEYKRGFSEGEIAGEQRGADRAWKEAKKQIDGLIKTIDQIGRLVAGVKSVPVAEISGGYVRSLPVFHDYSPKQFLEDTRLSVPAPAGFKSGAEDMFDKPITGGAMRMLKVLVSKYPMEFTRSQLGTLAQVKVSGGSFGTYLSRLKTQGYLNESGDKLTATDAGIEFLGDAKPEPQTADQTRDMWRERLTGGARRMFERLESAYPDGYNREALGEVSGVALSGGSFGTYLSRLKSNGLAVEKDGIVRLSDTLV